MPEQYLYGPVDQHFAEDNLGALRQAGDCLAFHWQAGVADVTIGPGDTWPSLCERLPDGWQPDAVFLNLSYTWVAPCLWLAPVPLVGLAGDWPWLIHWYRQAL